MLFVLFEHTNGLTDTKLHVERILTFPLNPNIFLSYFNHNNFYTMQTIFTSDTQFCDFYFWTIALAVKTGN